MHNVLTAGSSNSRHWLAAAIQIGLLAWSGAASGADKVYVANEEADTVSVVDTSAQRGFLPPATGRCAPEWRHLRFQHGNPHCQSLT